MQPLANLGLVSAMIAHEINNILTPLGNYAQLSLNNPDDTELSKKVISKTAKNSERATKILQSMLAMANGEKHDLGKHDLRSMVDEIFSCLARDFSKDGISVSIDIPEGTTAFVDRICFQQVLMNLILNAREAFFTVTEPGQRSSGGSMSITASEDADELTIKVSDTASGMSRDIAERIFDPFFTTKNYDGPLKKSGAGLGLAFCKRIVESHEGTINVRSEAGVGSTFTITLPSKES